MYERLYDGRCLGVNGMVREKEKGSGEQDLSTLDWSSLRPSRPSRPSRPHACTSHRRPIPDSSIARSIIYLLLYFTINFDDVARILWMRGAGR